MARPVKDGLDYFPKDTGFYHDPRIRALIGRFGCDGAALYDYILCEAYGRNGYYAEMDELSIDIIAADLGMSPEKIGLILDYLLNKSMLLDGTLFEAVKVLTSHGIQARYQEAVRGRAKKRGISVDGELWLLKEAETEGFIQVRLPEDSSGKNRDKSGKNPRKSQEKSPKEKKGKERKEKESYAPARVSVPTFQQVLEKAELLGCPECAKPFYNYYAAGGWRDSEGKPVFNWQQKLVAWQMRERKRTEKKADEPWVYDPGSMEGSL